MRGRGIASWYQPAARVWLTAAAASLALPASRRLGMWLPLHLALAGTATVSISGAMSTFASALTAARSAGQMLTLAQFASVNVGTACVAAGYPLGLRGLVAAGGALFVVAMLLLAVIVTRAWRIGLNKRHRLPFLYYGGALASIVVGATFGSLIGTRAIGGDSWVALRQAHMAVNVLGFVSLTIAGTLITLLPTVLRVRMAAARSVAAWALLAGLGAVVAGLATKQATVAAAGSVAYGLGAGLVVWNAVEVARTPRRHFVAVSAKHLLAALGWFLGGSVALSVALVRVALRGGNASLAHAFTGFQDVFLIAFAGGWIVQTLLGAWLYLLPTARVAGPQERRALLTAVELGGTGEVVALNGGLVLLAAHAAGAPVHAWAGAALALAGGGWALSKSWVFGLVARAPSIERRARALWKADGADR